MSVIPLKADIHQRGLHVRLVPIADIASVSLSERKRGRALTLDADDTVIERRVVPRPYLTREEAVTAIECIVSTFAEAGYEPAQKFWWAIHHDGDRTRFIIEGV